MNNIIFHGLFLSRSAKSCFGDDFSLLTGLIRSLVVKKVMMKQNQTQHGPDGHRHLPAVVSQCQRSVAVTGEIWRPAAA